MILKQLIKYDNANALEATWVNESGEVVRCHAYADSQMDMLRADLGADAATYESLIAEVEGAYVPTPPQPPQVPQVVTIRQAKLALHQSGLLTAVNSAVAQADPVVQIEWEYATEVRRDWPTLLALQSVLGLTHQQIDELFIQAGGL